MHPKLSSKNYSNRPAFTLVELLVVMAIVAMLVTLLLPAIQAARESGRKMTCTNNLRQLALGCQLHENEQGFLPSNGWGWTWVGDPRQGFGSSQPGGWAFSVLPYVEQSALHGLGDQATSAACRLGRTRMTEVALPIFICPSRRETRPYPMVAQQNDWHHRNVDDTEQAGRTDYVVNSGSRVPYPHNDPGPKSIEHAEFFVPRSHHRSNGVCFQRSEVAMRHLERGASKTLLLGEKFLNPDHYASGAILGDNQNLYGAVNTDVHRFTRDVPRRDAVGVPQNWSLQKPRVPEDFIFGSAHPSAVHMAYCDGRVDSIAYDIAVDVFSVSGNRKGI